MSTAHLQNGERIACLSTIGVNILQQRLVFVFINEQHETDLTTHPVLRVADSTTFQPDRPADFAKPFTPEHWGVVEAFVRDPDGRVVSLQAPLPAGVDMPDADARHAEKYGSG